VSLYFTERASGNTMLRVGGPTVVGAVVGEGAGEGGAQAVRVVIANAATANRDRGRRA
jgi:hypothetical protein